MMMQVGIYLFPEIEILDFAGPFEVFSTASRVFGRLTPEKEPPFAVSTIGESAAPIQARGGLVVTPRFSLASHPAFDLLIIPGGVVTAELQNEALIAWIRARSAEAVVASVCTGAFLLARAGILDGRSATTHWEDIADLREMFPGVRVCEDVRWLDEGEVVTSAGISAGIEMSLHLVARFAGLDLAVRTARQMEYDWTADSAKC
ncbi:MAG: DJ-1/PfpI family protein [Desulfoprunum sp.]|nr:DJ-1/PfpI family protein [Desulfoprunum sp.]